MAKRDAKGRLLPGQGALNPGGRPIGSTRELAELCRQHGPAAVATLLQVMQGGEPSDQIAACKVLLDRGYGRAPETFRLTGEDGGPVKIEVEAEREQLRAIIARVAGAADTKPA